LRTIGTTYGILKNPSAKVLLIINPKGGGTVASSIQILQNPPG